MKMKKKSEVILLGMTIEEIYVDLIMIIVSAVLPTWPKKVFALELIP